MFYYFGSVCSAGWERCRLLLSDDSPTPRMLLLSCLRAKCSTFSSRVGSRDNRHRWKLTQNTRVYGYAKLMAGKAWQKTMKWEQTAVWTDARIQLFPLSWHEQQGPEHTTELKLQDLFWLPTSKFISELEACQVTKLQNNCDLCLQTLVHLERHREKLNTSILARTAILSFFFRVCAQVWSHCNCLYSARHHHNYRRGLGEKIQRNLVFLKSSCILILILFGWSKVVLERRKRTGEGGLGMVLRKGGWGLEMGEWRGGRRSYGGGWQLRLLKHREEAGETHQRLSHGKCLKIHVENNKTGNRSAEVT